jgi:hypothetical protein
MKTSDQGSVSVPGLPREIREWIRQEAERELTSQAAVIRRLVAAAWKAQRDGGERAA